MSLANNLGVRAKLLRAALARRFVYPDVIAVAMGYGDLPVENVAGDLDPIRFSRWLARAGGDARPDFSALTLDALAAGPAGQEEWSTERATAEFIGHLAALLNAEVVIELGCFIGYTTAHLGTALKAMGRAGGLHYVDCSADFLATTKANLQRFRLEDLATAHHGASSHPSVLSGLPSRADLVFIDTSHSYEDTRAEIATYGPRLSERGCLALHDSIRFPGVRRAVAEARGDYGVLTFATERGNGLSVLVPRRQLEAWR